METVRIRDKHPGSATPVLGSKKKLLEQMFRQKQEQQTQYLIYHIEMQQENVQ